MKYAPVFAVDEANQCWKVIGILVQNRHGAAIIKMDHKDLIVSESSTLRAMEESYNEQFEEGELTFYERHPDEEASHIERLSTRDSEFIIKIKEKLAEGRSNILQIGDVETLDSENVFEHLDRLLAEVKTINVRIRNRATEAVGR